MTHTIEIPVEFKRLFDPDWREAAVYGGRFSLKSHTIARVLLIQARQKKKRTACFREFQNSIADSSHQLLADLIAKYEMNDFQITDNAIINTITGSDFLFKGLHRNEQSIKSIEGIDCAWCFVSGTLIDGKPIETLQPNDYVRSFNHKTGQVELRRVLRVLKRKTPKKLYELLISSGGKSIIGTGEHPIFVKDKGYVPLSQIKISDVVFYEKTKPSFTSKLFGWLWRSNTNKHSWSAPKVCEKWWSLLLGLCKEKTVRKNETQQPNESKRYKNKNNGNSEKDKAQTKSIGWKWKRIYSCTTTFVRETWARLVERTCCNDRRTGKNKRISNKLQNRFGKHLLYACNRVRWVCSSWSNFKRRRFEKEYILEESRVDSLTIQKQTDIEGLGLSDDGNYVYNLEVEVNNNYFANGILVHNCEEAQSISNQSIEVLTPTIRKPGSQIIYTYNRLTENDPVHHRLVVEGRPNTLVINVNYDIAEKYGWLPEAVKLEIEDDKEKRPALYKHKWLGEPYTLEAKIYKDWQQIDDIPHEARLERYGLDFGYSNDPAAIVAVYRYNGGYILDEVCYRKGMSNKQIADIILSQEEYALTIADSAEPKSIDEIRSYGVSITPSKKGKDSINQGIQLVQAQAITVTKRSENLWNEYKNYVWKTDKTGKIVNVPEAGNDHLLDGSRYSLQSITTNTDYIYVPRETRNWGIR